MRGGNTARRFLEIGELTDSCMFEDFRFGTTTGTGLQVAECASQYVLNAPPAGVRLKLTDSTFVSAAGAAFRIKGDQG